MNALSRYLPLRLHSNSNIRTEFAGYIWKPSCAASCFSVCSVRQSDLPWLTQANLAQAPMHPPPGHSSTWGPMLSDCLTRLLIQIHCNSFASAFKGNHLDTNALGQDFTANLARPIWPISAHASGKSCKTGLHRQELSCRDMGMVTWPFPTPISSMKGCCSMYLTVLLRETWAKQILQGHCCMHSSSRPGEPFLNTHTQNLSQLWKLRTHWETELPTDWGQKARPSTCIFKRTNSSVRCLVAQSICQVKHVIFQVIPDDVGLLEEETHGVCQSLWKTH